MNDDRALLDGYRQGQLKAFQTVIDRYSDCIRHELHAGFALRNGGRFFGFKRPFELQDALQDIWSIVFGEAMRRQYNGIDPFEPYLRRVVRNHVLALLRRKQRDLARLAGESELPDSPDYSPEADPQWGCCRENARTVFHELIDSCDSEERPVVQALHRDGLSQRVVAKTLGLRRSDVQRIEARFRKRALRLLKTRGIDSVGAVLLLAGVLAATCMAVCS